MIYQGKFADIRLILDVIDDTTVVVVWRDKTRHARLLKVIADTQQW